MNESFKNRSRDPLLARITADGRTQTLEEHLERTAVLARGFAIPFNAERLAETAAIYHDRGKAFADFKKYLITGEGKGEVKHSIYGAKSVLVDYSNVPQIGEILSNCIVSHHGKLRDYITPDGEAALYEELSRTDNLVPGCFQSGKIIEELLDELKTMLSLSSDEEKAFSISMITKLVYSCLVDADRLDAYLFETGSEYIPQTPAWEEMLNHLECYLNGLPNENEISHLRQEVSTQCLNAGLRERGVYQLSIPTGGGKTLSSLRFALKHACKHKLSRIIYVIPYLSILEQTAATVREALDVNDDVVLEHHSNFLPDEAEYYKLHTDRWDTPIILTTQVQFLESVFSAKGSNLRKFHNMANSVIIFDEVQSLPIKCIHLFNSTVNFLNRLCKSTILLCTATPPLLDQVKKPVHLSKPPEIAVCGNIPVRTEIVNALQPIGYTYPELADFVMAKHNESTLVIVNTKAAAKALVIELRSVYKNVLHLSTNMCPAHRDAVFKELRSNLDTHTSVICVSTQLIEAGVDISFECVIRDLAGLDSIQQAAGRCNRHGEFGEPKNVYIVNIKGENLSRLDDIKVGAEVTRKLLDASSKDIDMFYKHYFHDRQIKNNMDYPTNSGTIYDMLSLNCQGTTAYKNRGHTQRFGLSAAIRSAADAFFVIAPGQTDIVVPYGEAMELIEKFEQTGIINERRSIIRSLGRYSVALYKYQINELDKRKALSSECNINILSSGFYDAVLGVDLDGSHEFLYV